MKQFRCVVGLFCLLVGFQCCAATVATKYNFPKMYHFNGKAWHLAFQDESAHSILAEYVTNGESVTDWTQLFTYQQLRKPMPANVTPREVADHVDLNLKAKGIHYNFKILSFSRSEAMLEFQVKSPANKQQDELQRIVKRKDGIVVIIHYVTKKQDMGDAARKIWIENLKTVPLVLI